MGSARMRPVHIIGGGLAGSEAAWQAVRYHSTNDIWKSD